MLGMSCHWFCIHIIFTIFLVQDVAQRQTEWWVMLGNSHPPHRCLPFRRRDEYHFWLQPMDLQRRSQTAIDCVLEFLSSDTENNTTTAEIVQVATVSTNTDVHIGTLISPAINRLEGNV